MNIRTIIEEERAARQRLLGFSTSGSKSPGQSISDFDRFDTNGDGVIDKEEFEAAMASGIALTSTSPQKADATKLALDELAGKTRRLAAMLDKEMAKGSPVR